MSSRAAAQAQPRIALFALYRLGGAERMVDLEHIAVEAHRLAPELFKWRHYDLPSVETTRMAFRHAHDHDSQTLWLAGAGGRARMLTAPGIRRVREYADQLEADSDAGSTTAARPASREMLRMEAHPALERWRQGGASAVSVYDLADLLNCQPSAGRGVIEERLRMAEASAEHWKRTQLLEFLVDVERSLDQILEVKPA